MGQLLELIPTNLLEEISRSIEIKHVDNDQVVYHEGQEAEGM
jgi:hypothetical protein